MVQLGEVTVVVGDMESNTKLELLSDCKGTPM